MAPLHAAAAHHHAAAPPVFLARSPYHPRRAAAASFSLAVAATAAAPSSRKAFLSCPPDHWITAAPPRAIPSSSSSPALIASVQDLYDFIYSGPLVDRIGYTDEKIAESIDRWLLAGARLARLFRLNELQLSEAEKARIYHFYIPVFLWCEDQVMEHRAKYNDGDEIPPLVIGVSAPQGSGKTTLVFALDYLFRVAGSNSVTLSIDDFYLAAKEQNELRDTNPGNALLEVMDFVSRYLPAYQAYLPTLYKDGPNGSNPDHLLVIDIDENRNPICGGSWDIACL